MSTNTTLKIHQNEENLLSFKLEPASKKQTKTRSVLAYESKADQKSRKTSASNFFYNFENHAELHKLGQSFEQDFQSGQKVFSMSSPYKEENDVLSNLALASYFGAFCDVKATIIMTKDDMSKVHSMIYDFDQKKYKFKSVNATVVVYKSSFVNIIVLEDLIYLAQSSKKNSIDFDDLLKEIKKETKLLLMNVEINQSESAHKHILFSMLKCVSSMSLLVTFGVDRFDELDDVIDLLKNYNVEIKGVIVRQGIIVKPKVKSRGRR